MITWKADEKDRILFIEVTGTISEADIDSAMDAFQAQYPAVGAHLRGGGRGKFSIFLDWQKLEGWGQGAKTLGTLMTKTFSDAVDKVAVLADTRFAAEEERLADAASTAAVRFFVPAEREQALDWLRTS